MLETVRYKVSAGKLRKTETETERRTEGKSERKKETGIETYISAIRPTNTDTLWMKVCTVFVTFVS